MTINLDEREKSEDAMGAHSLVNNIGLPDAEAFWKHRERSSLWKNYNAVNCICTKKWISIHQPTLIYGVGLMEDLEINMLLRYALMKNSEDIY